MNILVNGDSREVAAELTVSGLVAFLGLAGRLMAVERNLEIVPMRLWDKVVLAEGDQIEIVGFVGGG